MIRFRFIDKLSGMQVLHRAILAFAILSLIAVSGLTTPEWIPLPDCRFKMLTGYSCPSCGMTHSFHAFATGRPAAAFHYNWMGPVLFVILIILFLKLLVEALAGKKTGFENSKNLHRIVCLIIPVLWLTFWAVRFSHEYAHAHSIMRDPRITALNCISFTRGGQATFNTGTTGWPFCPESRTDFQNSRNRVCAHDKP